MLVWQFYAFMHNNPFQYILNAFHCKWVFVGIILNINTAQVPTCALFQNKYFP